MRKLKDLRSRIGMIALAAIASSAPIAVPMVVNTSTVMAATGTTVGTTGYNLDGKNYTIGGKKLSGWQTFYFDAKTKEKVYLKNGVGQTGWFFDGLNYLYTKNGRIDKTAKKTGWVSVSGKTYYIKNNVAYTGWHQMGKSEGEKTLHWSYFGGDGVLRTGWQQMGKETGNPDGNAAKHWSYFGSNGWLRTGWVQLGKGTSEPDGNKAKHWSYFGDNGWLRTGWQQMGKGTNNPDGKAAKHWSYFGDNGWLRTGLQTMGTKTNPDGKNKQHLSYFGGNGWLVSNTNVATGGKHYWADGNGWLTVKTAAGNLYGDCFNGRKTIVIGDSRTVGAVSAAGGKYATEINEKYGLEYYRAKVGAGYSWFEKTIDNIDGNKLGKIDAYTDVVICMGVNDCNGGVGNWKAYANKVNAKANEWTKRGARVYFASVAPPSATTRYNIKIANVNTFNKNLKAALNGNVRWINTPGIVKFAGDGLHCSDTTRVENGKTVRYAHLAFMRGILKGR